MDLCRVIYKPDNSVAVIYAVSKMRKPAETDGQLVARFAKERLPVETDEQLLTRFIEERKSKETDEQLLFRFRKDRRPGEPTKSLLARFAKQKIPAETDEEFIVRIADKSTKGTKFADLPFDDISISELPTSDRDKWVGSKGNGVSIDTSIQTRSEKRQSKIDLINKEFKKPVPDINKIVKLQHDINLGNY